MALQDFINKFLPRKVTDEEETPEHFTDTGTSGTEVYAGNFNEEYLSTFLDMPEGIKDYDKMRRKDYQVIMLLTAIKNPILAASWSVTPVDETKEEAEIAEFIKFCLFEDIGEPDGSTKKTFLEFLTEAMTSLEFGFSLFEPVYKVVMKHPKWGNYIGLRDIAFRSQKTIFEWNLNKNGSIKNVRQLAQGDLGVDVLIPGEQLMPITFKKEGDNYEGISILRTVYGNYLRKDLYFKLQAMGIERCATGALVAKVPKGIADDPIQMAKIRNVLKRYTSHESNYLIFPESITLDVTQIPFKAEDVEKAIDGEDRRIAKSVLTGFLELGMTGQSGVNLGKDQSTIFLNGIEIYAKTVGGAVQNNIIKKLVDARYGKRVKYPQLKATDVDSKNGKERAEVIVMLKNAGIIRDSDQLEDAVSHDYDLPIISKEQKDREKKEGKGRASSAEKPEPKDPTDPKDPKGKKEAPVDKKKLSEAVSFAENNNASTFIHARAKNVHGLMEAQLDERVQRYLEKISKQFKKEPNIKKRRRILELSELPGKSDYKKKVRLTTAMLAEEATRNVLKEVKMPGVKFDEFTDILKNVPFALRDNLRANVDAVVTSQDEELKKRMFFSVSGKLDTEDSVNALIADMDKAAKSYIETGVLKTVATNLTSGTVNSARNAVFQTPEVFETIESFVIVNPDPDAPICKELAGRVFTKAQYDTEELPPYHHNCETTVRAQLVGQKNIKPVNPLGLTPTGTPEQVEKILKSKTFAEIIESKARPEEAIKSLGKIIDDKNEQIKQLKEENLVNTTNLVKVISGEA